MRDRLVKLVQDRIGGEPVCLFAYDLDQLTEHVRTVVESLPPRCRMFYAMKANSDDRLLRALAPLVAGFEVASGGELVKARAIRADIPVIFGGPAKTPQEIEQALVQGVTRLHAESVLELHRISEAATRLGRTADVLLRVNLAGPFPSATLAMAGRPTQFGISEQVLPDAVIAAQTLPGVRLAGFHLHSLSNNLSAPAHLELLEHYRRMVSGWEGKFGLRCEVLNVGGGIGVNYVNYADLGEQFDWRHFARGLPAVVAGFPDHLREIDFECGRYLVAESGSYAVEVLDVKRNHGVDYALVRGGTHHFRLPVSWQHSHPFTVLPLEQWSSSAPRPELRNTRVTVVGELCTPKDVLARDVPVARIRAGDVLVFSHAGAYGWEISHHDFLSHPHPEHVYYGDIWSSQRAVGTARRGQDDSVDGCGRSRFPGTAADRNGSGADDSGHAHGVLIGRSQHTSCAQQRADGVGSAECQRAADHDSDRGS